MAQLPKIPSGYTTAKNTLPRTLTSPAKIASDIRNPNLNDNFGIGAKGTASEPTGKNPRLIRGGN